MSKLLGKFLGKSEAECAHSIVALDGWPLFQVSPLIGLVIVASNADIIAMASIQLMFKDYLKRIRIFLIGASSLINEDFTVLFN